MSQYLELSGTASEIGMQHGEALRDQIRHCVEIYRGMFGLSDADIKTAVTQLRASSLKLAPELVTEIDAIAEGSNQSTDDIWAINARSELISGGPGECTALYYPQTGITAQTWDWIDLFEKLFVLTKITRKDGHKILVVTEPGIVGKIGLSDTGIGVGLNFLASAAPRRGLPVHLLLRQLLEARDLQEARALIDAAGPGRSGHVLFATAGDGGMSLEYTGDKLWTTQLQATPFVHTNHYLSCDIDPGDIFENTHTRFDKAVESVSASSSAASDISQAKAILSDQSRDVHNICAPYVTVGKVNLGTVCTVIMDLNAGQLELRAGPHPDAAFIKHSL